MPHPTIKPEIAYVYASAEIIRLSCLLSIPTARIAPYCLIRADTLMDMLLTILNSEIIPTVLWNFHHSSDTHPKWHMQSDHTICPDVLLLLLLLYKIFSYEFPLFHAKKAGYLPFHGNTSCQLSYYFHFFIIINLSKEKLPR